MDGAIQSGERAALEVMISKKMKALTFVLRNALLLQIVAGHTAHGSWS